METPSDNLYVAGLPEGTDDATFNTVFAQYGNVTSCRVLESRQLGHPLSGLVRMSTVDEAKWLVDNLSGGIPQGMTAPVTVRYAAQKSDKGWGKSGQGASAGGYQPYTTNGKGDPWSGASWGGNSAGADAASWQGSGKAGDTWQKGNWGSAASSKGGKAGSKLIDGVVQQLSNAGTLPGGKGSAVQPAVCLYVWGLPPDAQEVHLWEMFSPFGAVARVKIMRDFDSGTCKGFGFVNYMDAMCAQTAIAALNGVERGDGKTISVSIKADGKGKSAPGRQQADAQTACDASAQWAATGADWAPAQ